MTKVFRSDPKDDSLPFYFKVQLGKRRMTFNTKCVVRSEAAAKAKEIYVFLHSQGWGPTIQKYGSGTAALPTATVGQFLAKVEKAWLGQRRTIRDYGTSLRRVTADVTGISRQGIDRPRGPEREVWLKKTDAVRLSDLSREAIEEWRSGYVNAADGDHEKRKAAVESSNALLRACKSLFSAERLERLGLENVPNPFAKVRLLRSGDHRFVKSVEAADLLARAALELDTDIEAFKVLLLCLACGLRRNEADKIQWSAFNFDAGTLHVGPTKWLHPKSEKSIGTIELEPEVLALFRGWRARASTDCDFVLESDVAARNASSYAHYRARWTFERLAEWLRTRGGITSATPIHSLRKLYGSCINDKFGLHAASLALRHANIQTTASHYVAKRTGVTVGLGSVLSSKIIPLADNALEQRGQAV